MTMAAISDASELRHRLVELEEIYTEAKVACPDIPELRLNIPERSQSSLQRFSSVLLPRLSGLDPTTHPSNQQHLDAVIEKWTTPGHQYVRQSDANARKAIALIDRLNDIVCTLAEDLTALRNELDAAHSTVEKPARQPENIPAAGASGAKTTPSRRVSTRIATPEELASHNSPEKRPVRSTGPSVSSTELPTYVEGHYLRTNGHGILEIRIDRAFDEIDKAIADIAAHAREKAETFWNERARRGYMEILSRNDHGLDIGNVPSTNEFIDSIEKVRLNEFKYETIAQLVVATRDKIAQEAREKLQANLKPAQLVDVTLDLAVHTHQVLSRHVPAPDAVRSLTYFLHEALQKETINGHLVDENALRRVMSQYPKHAHSNPNVTFQPKFGR
jgi:hypothetical protein